jgi:hypothetical protein
MSSDSTPKYSGIIQYKVKEVWKDYEVTLEVDHTILTEEVATMINQFWSDDHWRLAAENGDVVRTVIRLFGSSMIKIMLGEGGSSFSCAPKSGDNPGPYWTADLHNIEGWGGTQSGTPYGFCGIRVIAADVEELSFDDVELEAIGHA